MHLEDLAPGSSGTSTLSAMLAGESHELNRETVGMHAKDTGAVQSRRSKHRKRHQHNLKMMELRQKASHDMKKHLHAMMHWHVPMHAHR